MVNKKIATYAGTRTETHGFSEPYDVEVPCGGSAGAINNRLQTLYKEKHHCRLFCPSLKQHQSSRMWKLVRVNFNQKRRCNTVITVIPDADVSPG
jgi:hypothetical protein